MDIMKFVEYPVVMVVVMMLSELVKKAFDKEGKYKKYYLLIPTVIGLVASVLSTMAKGWDWADFGINVMVYVTACTYVWKFGKTMVGIVK